MIFGFGDYSDVRNVVYIACCVRRVVCWILCIVFRDAGVVSLLAPRKKGWNLCPVRPEDHLSEMSLPTNRLELLVIDLQHMVSNGHLVVDAVPIHICEARRIAKDGMGGCNVDLKADAIQATLLPRLCVSRMRLFQEGALCTRGEVGSSSYVATRP